MEEIKIPDVTEFGNLTREGRNTELAKILALAVADESTRNERLDNALTKLKNECFSEEQQLSDILSFQEVREAIRAIEHAKLRRDSVARKLHGESTAVTGDTLVIMEQELDHAHKNWNELQRLYPALTGYNLLVV